MLSSHHHFNTGFPKIYINVKEEIRWNDGRTTYGVLYATTTIAAVVVAATINRQSTHTHTRSNRTKQKKNKAWPQPVIFL